MTPRKGESDLDKLRARVREANRKPWAQSQAKEKPVLTDDELEAFTNQGCGCWWGGDEMLRDECGIHKLVAEIRRQRLEGQYAMAACRALIKPPLNESTQNAIDLAIKALAVEKSSTAEVVLKRGSDLYPSEWFREDQTAGLINSFNSLVDQLLGLRESPVKEGTRVLVRLDLLTARKGE